MDITLDKGHGSYHINSYNDGTITINEQGYHSTVLLGLELLQVQELPKALTDLTIENLNQLKTKDYEVFLLGTGEELNFPSWELLEQAQILGTPIEVMTTGAACRTYTVLASEGRQVLALLFP